MNSKDIDNKNYNLEETLKLAIKSFRHKKPETMSQNTSCSYVSETGNFLIYCMGQEFLINYPSGEIKSLASGENPSLIWQILMLHYLTNAVGSKIQNKYITFKELPGGNIYVSPFHKRAITPLIKHFSIKPELLLRAGKLLGGRTAELGDYSVTINALPRIPITYVIWLGDEEIPASGNILFDASAPDYLPTEDYAFLASLTIYEMLKRLK